MFVHPDFDPIALQLGPLSVRWYGLMYLLAFITVIVLGRHRIKRRPDSGWNKQMLDDVLFFGVLGVVIGGRLGHVLFYQLDYYLANPLHILYVWEGGMSFHGGLLGVIAAMALYARRIDRSWLAVTDFIAPLTPLGLGFGRIGNFINGELWGRATDVPWGMVFPRVDGLTRHPSQLYEFALEGLALFAIVWLYSNKPRPLGAVSGVFLIGYGAFRFLLEFTREPDNGFLWLGLSLGQWYSLPMLVAGGLMLAWAQRKRG